MDFLQRRQVQAAAEQLHPDLVLKFEALHLLLRAGIISHIDQMRQWARRTMSLGRWYFSLTFWYRLPFSKENPWLDTLAEVDSPGTVGTHVSAFWAELHCGCGAPTRTPRTQEPNHYHRAWLSRPPDRRATRQGYDGVGGRKSVTDPPAAALAWTHPCCTGAVEVLVALWVGLRS